MSERHVARRRRIPAAILGLACAGLIAACGTDDTSASGDRSAATASSSTAASSSAATTGSVEKSAGPSTTPSAPKPSAQPQATRPAELPTNGSVESVAPPQPAQQSAFERKLREGGLEIDPSAAASLGDAVCRVGASSGQDSAKKYAAALLQAQLHRAASDKEVSVFVDASKSLC
ncbi:hypothetical protein ND991_10745 [Gordonia sputi]|uniref:hypothetical protein n=1 Tax=Gordonia sputi TaxID=36823 RepID=UPI002043AE85|nr:hypothetical protein [Gordonia sputi]MCM3895689.1 hypothetical protein [Gordonia sputi]